MCALYVQATCNKVYATETYIMYLLEAARFLNAPDLAGREVPMRGVKCTLRPASRRPNFPFCVN